MQLKQYKIPHREPGDFSLQLGGFCPCKKQKGIVRKFHCGFSCRRNQVQLFNSTNFPFPHSL